jgi:hypothetical protein
MLGRLWSDIKSAKVPLKTTWKGVPTATLGLWVGYRVESTVPMSLNVLRALSDEMIDQELTCSVSQFEGDIGVQKWRGEPWAFYNLSLLLRASS